MLSKTRVLILLIFLTLLTVKTVTATDPLTTFENNLDMSIADICFIIISCGLVIMTAFDTRVALMMGIMLYAVVFVVFTLATEEGYTQFNPYYSGVAMMLCFVIMCVSLLVTYKKGNTPINVV